MSFEKEAHVIVHINPPPVNRRCECCNRHADDLKPFGGHGDPLLGDFKGALLVKTFRGSHGTVSASYECRDCIVLCNADYQRKKHSEDRQESKGCSLDCL